MRLGNGLMTMKITNPHTTAANDRYAQLLALSRMGANKDEAARSVGLSLAGMHGLLWRRLGSGVWPVQEK